MRRKLLVLARRDRRRAREPRVLPPRGGRRRERVDLYFADGSMVSLGDGSPEAERLLPVARTTLDAAPLTDARARAALLEHAYLEGDFVLRSGSPLALLPRQVPLRDAARPARGARRAHRRARCAEHEPEATRLAAPELGAVALAAAASLESGLPFLIVRKAAKDYGTANRLEGVFEAGECVCLVEDVVTSGGAAARRRRGAPRGRSRRPHGGLRGRPRGGRRGRARAPRGAPAAALPGSESRSSAEKVPQNRMVERNPRPC